MFIYFYHTLPVEGGKAQRQEGGAVGRLLPQDDNAHARTLARARANNCSPFRHTHAQQAKRRHAARRRGSNHLFYQRHKNDVDDRENVDSSVTPSAARWQHRPYHFQSTVSFPKQTVPLTTLQGAGVALHAEIQNKQTKTNNILQDYVKML